VNAALALLSSVMWGASDFGGGRLADRLPAPLVLAVSQAVALLVLLAAAVVALMGTGIPVGRYLLFGAAAGVIGPLALGCYYRALAIGPMGLVAPVAATGGVVPVVVGVEQGDRLGVPQVVGIVLALGGAALAAVSQSRGPAGSGRGIALAAVSGLGFGAFYPLVAEGTRTSILGTLLLARLLGVLAVVAFLAVSTRRIRTQGAPAGVGPLLRSLPAALLPPLVAVGLLDLGANAAFMLASRTGALAVDGTLGSLYPVVTAALAALVIGERLSRVQFAGAGLALAGVLLLSS
jgi:drug/metabolite transporter (DMT)-like permease